MVDFGYVGNNGETIYMACFQRYLNSRISLQKSKADWAKLIVKTEDVFNYLVKKGEKKMRYHCLFRRQNNSYHWRLVELL